jgi:hypothetical protein
MTHILIVPCNPSAFSAAKSVTRRELFAFAIDADEPIERTGWRGFGSEVREPARTPRIEQWQQHALDTSDGVRIIDAELLGRDRARAAIVAQHVSAVTNTYLTYFAGRTDGLRPPNNSEELLVATT